MKRKKIYTIAYTNGTTKETEKQYTKIKIKIRDKRERKTK